MDDVQAALKTWRDGLVGLTRTSQLIGFKPRKTSTLRIDSPSPDHLLEALRTGTDQRLVGDLEPDATDGTKKRPSNAHFHCARPDSEVGTVARSLMRRASSDYLERGVSILYMSFGLLEWKDIDDKDMVSPILLQPVELHSQGPKATPTIAEGDDGAVINPALLLRLKEFGIELPEAEDLDSESVTDVLDLVRTKLETADDAISQWTMTDDTYLGTFSFMKEAMFRDLQDNEAAVLASPLVRALATSNPKKQTAAFRFNAIPSAQIDDHFSPEVTPLVLDADSSQRAAIAAALAGKSFVLDGPPGTGKSQTIANMIGSLVHANKSVLFVSEKIAALDVVRNRLADAGLASYLLELHSHKASRKEVAVELMNTLDNTVRPPHGMTRGERNRIRQRREQLNAYAAAMNEVRKPLSLALHDVIGKHDLLSDSPAVPAPATEPLTLSQEDLFVVEETLSQLGRAWRPAVQGDSFTWRDVIVEHPLETQLARALDDLSVLQSATSVNEALMRAFNLSRPSDARMLDEIIGLATQAVGGETSMGWLSVRDTEPINTSLNTLRQLVSARRKSISTVEALIGGQSWTSIPQQDQIPPEPNPLQLTPAAVPLHTLSTRLLTRTANTFDSDAVMLEDHRQALQAIASELGLPTDIKFSSLPQMRALLNLKSRAVRLESTWFTPCGLEAARAAARRLSARTIELRTAEAAAASMFTPSSLDQPLAELQDRFQNLHRGLRKLSGAYRTDKRALAEVLVDASQVKVGISRLDDALRWNQTRTAFTVEAAESSHALGQYWDGANTDYQALDVALKTVDEILRYTGADVHPRTVQYFTGAGSSEPYSSVLGQAEAAFEAWRRTLADLPTPAGRPALYLGLVEDARTWLSANAEVMRAAAARTSAIEAALSGDWTLGSIAELYDALGRAHEHDQAVSQSKPKLSPHLGAYFRAEDTPFDEAQDAIDWVDRFREFTGTPLTSEQIESVASAQPADNLIIAIENWERSSQRIITSFDETRQGEIASELDHYELGPELLEDLKGDTRGQLEWFQYAAAMTTLNKFGLVPVVQYCASQRYDETVMQGAIMRSLYGAWIDWVFREDDRLNPKLAKDRTALVEEYRALDRDLTTAATSEIIESANARRATNSSFGEPGIIRREGAKQKKHKSVRELMNLTQTVTPSIKPVFMMSPLAVSQFLPPTMKFDVVIFDEASQVTPGDAINCVYRGDALILAGDDKQLPPTSFFARTTDDEEDPDTDVADFQSILELAKASGALQSISLNWHYRSRHEDLIAFSNYKFYSGKLITFPSARAQGSDVGVEFFHAGGTYQRGGGAINPVEAQKVAQRVIDHYSTRPDLSLGVVTFSVAQADAVQRAIDDARTERRDLDVYFDTDDRLDGFFIRALEQVQGDERDVIIFSVGYGPDEAGKISTNFGALNRDKGWRRLNVGITRARQRVEVVASMHAHDIPPSTNENVEYLRAYLDYAERGQKILAVPYSSTGLDAESPFEESVIAAIRGWGYVVEPQVGAAGYRIDIGVRHPSRPGAFVLGVECDGFQYHSAQSARDRDRLRDQVLTGLGWTMHRIWGTAWYRDKQTEEARLINAIETAIREPESAEPKQLPTVVRAEVETVETMVVDIPSWVIDYSAAPAQSLHWRVEVGAAGSHRDLIEPLTTLVTHESPVHISVIEERIRDWWSIGRIGPKIRRNLDLALEASELIADGDFYIAHDSEAVSVRGPGEFSRKAEHVHVSEISQAITLLVRDVGSLPRPELITAVRQIFGWNRSGVVVTRRIEEALKSLVSAGTAIEQGGVISEAQSEKLASAT
ncbi:DUF4011 domain-containing protein [Gordonia sp. (in: high G+C Gram-positive bacteria)]|uniref:DUF4011 domain-containing protein n=1 Tax=Gordonia sp. (in: high G+C Gram-positive bacteria) TaxID=84139 RepID=UPI003C7218D3